MPIKIEMVSGQYIASDIAGAPAKVLDAVEVAMQRVAIALQAYIQREKLSGDPLHQRTGVLKGSINQHVERDDHSVSAVVSGAGGPAYYGWVHEFGGTFTVPEHYSTSRLGNRFVVRAHNATYPERSFMRSSFEETKDQFVQWIQDAIRDGMSK